MPHWSAQVAKAMLIGMSLIAWNLVSDGARRCRAPRCSQIQDEL